MTPRKVDAVEDRRELRSGDVRAPRAGAGRNFRSSSRSSSNAYTQRRNADTGSACSYANRVLGRPEARHADTNARVSSRLRNRYDMTTSAMNVTRGGRLGNRGWPEGYARGAERRSARPTSVRSASTTRWRSRRRSSTSPGSNWTFRGGVFMIRALPFGGSCLEPRFAISFTPTSSRASPKVNTRGGGHCTRVGRST